LDSERVPDELSTFGSNRVTLTGGSEYKLNGKVITYSKYNAALEGHNILVKAKNFLVFQVRFYIRLWLQFARVWEIHIDLSRACSSRRETSRLSLASRPRTSVD
jgi:hypothetical protein